MFSATKFAGTNFTHHILYILYLNHVFVCFTSIFYAFYVYKLYFFPTHAYLQPNHILPDGTSTRKESFSIFDWGRVAFLYFSRSSLAMFQIFKNHQLKPLCFTWVTNKSKTHGKFISNGLMLPSSLGKCKCKNGSKEGLVGNIDTQKKRWKKAQKTKRQQNKNEVKTSAILWRLPASFLIIFKIIYFHDFKFHF